MKPVLARVGIQPGGIFFATEEFFDPDYPLARTVIKQTEGWDLN